MIHERLVAEHGFTDNYQRTKMFLAEARPRIAAELAAEDENPLTGLHRRFEVVPGAQAQVDWGDEGDLLAHVGIANVYSFHMTLSRVLPSPSELFRNCDVVVLGDRGRGLTVVEISDAPLSSRSGYDGTAKSPTRPTSSG